MTIVWIMDKLQHVNTNYFKNICNFVTNLSYETLITNDYKQNKSNVWDQLQLRTEI